jgi:gliding motility-associated-like protein
MKTRNHIKFTFTVLTLLLAGITSTGLSAQSTVISSQAPVHKWDETVYTVYIPNSFTPNADGVNDQFTVYSEQLKRINLKIYDQGGQEVYNTSELGQGWNGQFHNRELHQDTYLYRVEAEYTNGYSEVMVGPLTLIR